MKIYLAALLAMIVAGIMPLGADEAKVEADARAEDARLATLDAYWAEVSRTVGEGDFEGYRATCHPEAVLVSGKSETSYPLSEALARWKAEFDATREGEMEAEVSFRFSQRFGDARTAHETGIFRYSATPEDGEAKVEYIHFEALLVHKADGGWQILMEYQKSPATAAEWDALAD